MEEHGPAVPPRAPTVPMHPYEHHVQRTYDRVQAMRDSQRKQAVVASTPASLPRHFDHGQATHTTTPLPAQGSSSAQFQVIDLWGKTPIKFSFDPDAPGEAFYQAFHQWAVRRHRDGEIERDRMILRLKSSKNTPEDEALDLELKESALEEPWEAVVEWMQENKNPKAPHLYATVELEAG